MAISTSKQEIYAEGTTDISWTRLQTNSLLQGANDATNIRFGAYKRNPNDTSETPLVPDADENANIGTEESGNLRVGAFRGAIKRHDVTFDNASEYENVEFDKYFGANLVKNVPKELNVDGIIYSHDVNEPAAKIDTNDSIRNLTVGIGTSGAIYGAGAAATTATQGIAGGTALYVSSGTNSRNFTINLESSGGSFGKLYGGGGGGVTGGTGEPETITCTRFDQEAGPGLNQQGEVISRVGIETTYHQVTGVQSRVQPGTTNPYVQNGPHYQGTNTTVPGFTGVEWARDWNARAEAFCESTYGSIANSADGGGAPSDFDGIARNQPVYAFYQAGQQGLPTSPIRTEPGPDFVQGVLQFNCDVPSFDNPPVTTYHPYSYLQPRTTNRYRSETADITSAGGLGGPGGKGQGYQRAFTQGTSGSDAVQVTCSDLGTFYHPGSTDSQFPRTGEDGTSGGDWGQPGGTSYDEQYTGGLGGYAVQVANSEIAIEILGKDDPDKLKGRNNVERDDFT